MSLERLIELIDEHRSLQRAEIRSAESYRQRIGGIAYRFLVLELQRQDHSPIWLRLDRRRDTETGSLQFFLALLKTPANDTVRLLSKSDDGQHLLIPFHLGYVLREQRVFKPRRDPRESLGFKTLSILGEFRHILRVIYEELSMYKVWPVRLSKNIS